MDYDQKTRKTTEILVTSHFMAGIEHTTWYKCANRNEKAEFLEVLASGLGQEDFVTRDKAYHAVALAIKFNLRTHTPFESVSVASLHGPVTITMNEALKHGVPDNTRPTSDLAIPSTKPALSLSR